MLMVKPCLTESFCLNYFTDTTHYLDLNFTMLYFLSIIWRINFNVSLDLENQQFLIGYGRQEEFYNIQTVKWTQQRKTT